MMTINFISALERQSVGEVTGIFIRTVEGELGILADHIPLVAELREGSIVRVVRRTDEVLYTLGKNSFFKFSDNRATVLTQSFERKDGNSSAV